MYSKPILFQHSVVEVLTNEELCGHHKIKWPHLRSPLMLLLVIKSSSSQPLAMADVFSVTMAPNFLDHLRWNGDRSAFTLACVYCRDDISIPQDILRLYLALPLLYFLFSSLSFYTLDSLPCMCLPLSPTKILQFRENMKHVILVFVRQAHLLFVKNCLYLS